MLKNIFYFTIMSLLTYSGIVSGFNKSLDASLKYLDFEIPLKSTFNDSKRVKKIVNNKVIIVGDSRMYLLNKRGDQINVPVNFNFLAEPGVKIDWLEDKTLEQLEYRLSHKDRDYVYHVIYNLGVNDLDDDGDPREHSADYYNIYKKLVIKYPDVHFYFLSVNPIDDDLISKSLVQKRSSDDLVAFNEYFMMKIGLLHVNNAKYCDAYNSLEFSGPDGLHYDKETDKKIVDFIVNKCLDYN